jgi:uncharacterized protein YkwD
MTRPPARPPLWGRRQGLLARLAIAAALGLVMATPGLTLAWTNYTFSSTDENLMVTLINQARANNGLKALIVDSTLTTEARSRSKDMYDKNYLSHYIPPDGHTVFDELKAKGYCYKTAGENIGKNNYPDDVATQTLFNGWMSSSGHKANILGTSYDHIGVGAYKGGGTTYPDHVWTAIFVQKCSTSPTPSPTPRPTPTPTPRPTATPKPTVKPTATPKPTVKPTATPTPVGTPVVTPGPTPTATPEPTPTPLTLDPAEQLGALASSLKSHGNLTGAPGPEPEPSALPEPTSAPEPTGEPVAVNVGPQVIEPLPTQSLLDTIVGGVTASFFGD